MNRMKINFFKKTNTKWKKPALYVCLRYSTFINDKLVKFMLSTRNKIYKAMHTNDFQNSFP